MCLLCNLPSNGDINTVKKRKIPLHQSMPVNRVPRALACYLFRFQTYTSAFKSYQIPVRFSPTHTKFFAHLVNGHPKP